MAVLDILAQAGDKQDFIMELPVGNSVNTPMDILIEEGDSFLCMEVPVIVPDGGGNIFIMSE